MEEKCHATTHNRFYPDMSNVNKNITVEANLSAHLGILKSKKCTVRTSRHILCSIIFFPKTVPFIKNVVEINKPQMTT